LSLIVHVWPEPNSSTVPVIIRRIPRFEELIADDGQIRRQAVARGEYARDTVRGARLDATQIKISGVDREAMLVERELDFLDGETWHGPEACTGPVLGCAFGTGYEGVKGGCERGRDVDQRSAGVYCL